MTILNIFLQEKYCPTTPLLSQRLNDLQFYYIILHRNILLVPYKLMFININVLIMKILNTLFSILQ